MAYDEGLAERLRQLLADRDDLQEKKMFGGLSFLLNGNLCCGVIGDDLIVRVGPEASPAAIQQPHARLFDFTGKPMKGWVVVAPQGIESDEELQRWVEMGLGFAGSLPPK
jgi:TfoX/Sxy family transcriptional regulator of competence genes